MEYILLLLNNVFAFFDRIIAWAIAEVYNLIIQVSASSVLDADVVKQFSGRVSVFLSLFMLFWLALRMIKYVITPEMVNDQAQGFGKITTNVVVMLAMLLLVNYAFTYAMEFQNIVVKSNVLMRAIFGVSDKASNPVTSGEDVGNQMAYYLYAAFISPSDDLTACRDFYGLSAKEANDCADAIEDASSYAVSRDWVTGHNTYQIKRVLSSNVVSARDGSNYLFNYTPVISTICGLVMLVLVVTIAIDVAVRVVKLAFLQIIAPIPIISYIDPNSGKDGIFKNWLKMVGSTYASLFIKLITIYFAVFFISYAARGEIILDGGKKATLQGEPFIIVLIIIGTLMFAKTLPKVLSEIFGVDTSNSTFSSVAKGFKKAGNIAGGLALGAAGGLAAGAYAGARQGGAGGFIKHGLGGFFGGGFRGTKNALKGQNAFKAAGGGIASTNMARNARSAYADLNKVPGQHYNAFDRMIENLDEKAGVLNSFGGYGKMDEQIHKDESTLKKLDAERLAYQNQAKKIQFESDTHSASEFDSIYKEWQDHKDKYSNDPKINAENALAMWEDRHLDDETKKYINVQEELKRVEASQEETRGIIDKRKAAYAARNEVRGSHGHGGKK